MEQDQEKIIEKLRTYLEDKNDLDLEQCYFLTKAMNEMYWDEIQSDTDSDDEEDDIEDNSEDDDEDYEDEDNSESIDQVEEKELPKEKVNPKKSKLEEEDEYDFDEPSSIIKKPRIKVKE